MDLSSLFDDDPNTAPVEAPAKRDLASTFADDPGQAKDAVKGETAWSDYPKAALAGVYDVSGQIQGGLASVAARGGYKDAEALISQREKDAHQGAQEITQSMTPAAQASQEAGITSGDFWEHPGRAIALKTARMAPAMTGLIGAGAVGGVPGAVAAGAAMGAGQYADAMRTTVDDHPDADLQAKSAYYAGLRSSGLDEASARSMLKLDLEDANGGLLINAGVGGAANAVGLGGIAGRAMTGGVFTRMGKEALLGGVPNAIQAGVGEATTQTNLQRQGLHGEFDYGRLADVALEGGAFGALPGAAHGAFRGKEAPAPRVDPSVAPPGDATPRTMPDLTKKTSPNVAPVQAAPELGPDPSQAAALPMTPKPAPGAQPTPGAPSAPAPAPQIEGSVSVAPPELAKPPAPAPAGAPANDVGQNVPEAPATLQAQEQALAEGRKKAVLYPKGTDTPTTPEGMKSVRIAEGTIHYDPEQIKRADVYAAKKAGKLNELLDLGPVNKEEVAQRVQAGEQPVAVVERTPEGVEAKAAAGTDQTAPEQIAALEETKLAPENTVGVEPPQQVLQDREAANAQTAESVAAPLPADSNPVVARAPRILEDITPEGKKAAKAVLDLKPNLKAMAKEEAGPQGKNWTKAQKEQREQSAANAKTLFEKHSADELRYVANKDVLDKFQERLQAISDAADEAGIDVKSKVGYEGTDNHLVWLADIERVLKTLRQKKGSAKERLHEANSLVLRETAARGGDFSVMRDERKAEGDQAKRQSQGDVETINPDALQNGTAGQDTAHGTKISKSNTGATIDAATEKRIVLAKGKPVEVEGAKAASPVRSVSDEERAAIAAKYGAGPKTVGKAKEAPVFMQRAESSVEQTPRKPAREPAKVTEPTRLKTNTGQEITPHETTKVDDLLAPVDWREHGKTLAGNRVAGLFSPLIAKRVREIVGDVAVHMVDRDEMQELTKSKKNPDGFPADGYYHPGNNHIVLDSDVLSNAARTRHVVMHEALHAALYHAIERNPRFKAQLRSLMDEFLRKTNKPLRISEADAREIPAKEHYAFSLDGNGYPNVHEFLSEALSNPAFARELAKFHISNALAERLGLHEWRERSGWYGTIASGWDALVAMARKALDLPARSHTALEAAMSIAERAAMEHPNHPENLGGEPVFMRRPKDEDTLPPKAPNPLQRAKITAANMWRRGTDKVETLGMLSRDARDLFGPNDPMRRVYEMRRAEAVEKGQILREHGGEKLTHRAATLERKYRKEAPAEWDKMVSLAYNATLHNIDLWGDNKHFGKDKKLYWQARAMEPKLKAELRALPPDLQEFVRDTAKFYRDEQNALALGHIQNLLKEAGVNEPGLAERIHADGLTEEDRAKFKTNEVVDQIDKARELKRIDGTYFPLRRYGDHIVSATHDIEVPQGSIQVAPDTIQFTSQGNRAKMLRDAKAAVQSMDLRQNGAPKMVWVDKNNPTTLIDAEHADAIPAIRVRLHNKEVHFAEGEAAARTIQAELAARDGYKVTEPRLQDKDPYSTRGSLMSSELEKLVEKKKKQLAAEREKDNPDTLEIAKLSGTIDSLYQSTVAMRAGNRIQSTMLPRRNIAGFSKDFTRTLAEYADMSAGYLSRLKHRPDVEAALKEAHEFKKERPYDAETLRRDELYREVQDRVYGDERYEHGAADTIIRRVLQMSMLDKLGGVSYHIINAMEPAMSSAPYIGGKHGMLKAYGQLTHAYNLIGGRGAAMAGLRDTAKAFGADHGFTDYVDFFKKNAAAADPKNAKGIAELLDRLHDRGLLDKEAEFEVRFMAHPESNVVGRALDKADLIVRQMGVAVESINRAATGIAAYLAELDKTGDHTKAMDYAFDVVHDTMGDYSRVNAPPIFNHPMGRIALQFKKYGQKQYYLLGKLMKGAIAGDKEKQKQLAGVLLTHAVMAGTLGLPLEPIRMAVIGANILAGTGFTWEDFEEEARKRARQYLGETGGKLATRGVPRALGVDLAGRVGLDTLLTRGEPRSKKPYDLTEWLSETIAGAPAAEVFQLIGAVSDLTQGNWADASKAIPIKAVHDVVSAVKGYREGKKTARGYEGQKPYTLGEAAFKAIGLKPASEAENSERRSANYHQTVRQKQEHDAFVLRWIEAKPADRGKLWGEVEKWNKARPRDAQLTRSKLDAAARQRQTKIKKGQIVGGQQVNKYNRYIFEQNEEIYGE